MALFIIVAIDSAAALEAKIQQLYPNDYYEIAQGKWFVVSPMVTAKQLSAHLEITPSPPAEGMRAVVVSVRGYFGRGPKDMWEWVAAKSTEVNA
jgi:hypothetical protein